MKPQMKRSLTRMLTLLPHTIPDLPFAIASELHLLLFYQSTTVSLFMLERRKTIVVWVLHFFCRYKSCATYFIASSVEMCSLSSASKLAVEYP
jgi:hypothetical protein